MLNKQVIYTYFEVFVLKESIELLTLEF